MKPSFFLLIFNPPSNGNILKDVREKAFSLGYTMFTFNWVVFSTSDGEELFNLSDLY